MGVGTKRSPAKPIRTDWSLPFSKAGCQFWLVNYGGEFCRGCASTKSMDIVSWGTWTPGLPQINTKTNCILTPVVCIDATRSKTIAKHHGNQWFWIWHVFWWRDQLLFFRLAICCTYYQCILNMLFRAVLESKPHWVRMLLCCPCSRRLWLTKHQCA